MDWLIYGANGYTGKLIAERAKSRGHTPILAGRHPQRIHELSRELELPARVFDLHDAEATARELQGIAAVLHCAGPFSATAKLMLDACLAARSHYLDITGEADVLSMQLARSEACAQAGVVAIPAVGFDVVPTDCLAALLKESLPDAVSLKLAFAPSGGSLSPGTAKTAVERLGHGGLIRRDGRLVDVPAGYKSMTVPFAHKPLSAVTIPWGDVVTAYHSTGIPNIEVYLAMPPKQIRAVKLSRYMSWLLAMPPVQSYLKRRIEQSVQGPSAERRGQVSVQLWGEVENAAGTKITRHLLTPEGYTLTADSAVKAMEHVLSGRIQAGSYTPSQAFGAGFIRELDGVTLG